MDRARCSCGRWRVMPAGPEHARILIVGDAPTKYEVKGGEPWTGDIGDLLRTELRRAGIRSGDVRFTNMWQHGKTTECSLDEHLDMLLPEMVDKDFVVLVGADAVKYFTGKNVSDISGLEVESSMVPNGARVFAMFSPAVALHDKLGEVRLAMEKLGRAVKDV